MVNLSRQPLLRVIARSAGGIARETVVIRAAEQCVNGLVEQLAFQIPERGLDAADDHNAETHAAPEVAAMVHAAPEFGDIVDGLTDQNRFEELDDARDNLGAKVSRVRLADADRAVGDDLDKGRAAQFARLAQKRIVRSRAGQEGGANVHDFHGWVLFRISLTSLFDLHRPPDNIPAHFLAPPAEVVGDEEGVVRWRLVDRHVMRRQYAGGDASDIAP